MSFFKEILAQKGPFILAEIGVNYYDIAKKEGLSVLEGAKRMIDEAIEAGAHAVKFQSYKAGKIASKHSPAYWDRNEEPTESQFELFKKFDQFGKAEYGELARYTNKQGGVFCSTPFDFESADYLEPLMPFYKISSSDLTNHPFIEHMAKKGKPILLSTGAATIGEIEEALEVIEKTGNKNICIMHCVLSYPTLFENANLEMIRHLEAVFPGYLLGYSDHTRPDPSMAVLTTAYLFGAKVIEKHFTLDKNLPGNDHYHAMDPKDLRRFSEAVALIDTARGHYRKVPLPCEGESRKQARRSLVAARDIAEGEVLEKEMLTFKRPGTGISPKDLHRAVGRTVRQSLRQDDIVTWDHL